MRIIESALMFTLAVITFSVSPCAEANELVWGKDVGYMSGIVTAADDAKGLAVRSDPSQTAKTLTHLKPGTRIHGTNVFRDGWVNVRSPAQDGWVRLSFLQPDPFEGAVTKVGQPDFCLPLVKGPGDSYEQIGCAQIGEVLKFSGVATQDNWLQLADRKGWVPASHIGLDAWAAVAGTSEQWPPASSLDSDSRKPTAEAPAVARQVEPGFPVRPPEEEDEGESPDAQVCSDKWCVDFANNAITREGNPESFVTCARDETCARILAEFWVALLEDDEHVEIFISNTMSIRVARDGSIRNPASGGLIKYCGGASGPDVECTVSLLLDISQPVANAGTENSEPTAAPAKGTETSPGSQSRSKAATPNWPEGTPAAASAKPSESAKPEARSPKERVTRESKSEKPQVKQTRSKERLESDAVSPTNMFADPFFDQDSAHQKRLEESWDDALRRRF